MEERDVAVINIQNAFINTWIEHEKDMAIINIRVILVDMLLDISPNVYGLYMAMDRKGIKQLVTQYMNAIYGTMDYINIYYFMLMIVSWYKRIPISMTVSLDYYVNNTKVFEYGSGTMQVNCGKVHKYLGMTLDYSKVGQVNITMFKYIIKILDVFDIDYPTGGGTK